MLRDDGQWLQLNGVRVHYGANPALTDIAFDLRRGESLAIAGSNGAGKTTVLQLIVGAGGGMHRRQSGGFALDGIYRDLALPVQSIDRRVSLVPERAKVFTLLTVEDNFRVGSSQRKADFDADDVYGWFPRLHERRKTLAGNLSGGEQQMLGIGLGLLSSPELLLLDEPTLGLAVPIIEELCVRLEQLRRDLNLTLIVAESDSQWLPRLAQRAVVLDRGVVAGRFDTLGKQEVDAIHALMLGLSRPVVQEAVHHA